MSEYGFLSVVRREIKRLTSRPIYLVGMTLVPIFMALFFVNILGSGLPLKVPAAIVDLDHSPLSRQTTRSLNAMELVDIVQTEESFNKAMQAVQSGEVFGFFVIPRNFERDALSGKAPTITFYNNLTYYVPGTLVFKGFKTMAVTTSGRVVQTKLVNHGMPSGMAGAFMQPMNVAVHPLDNPWTNYSYYLSTSFIPGVLQLMIFLMTVFAITHEFKSGSATEWLERSRGDVWTAVLAKLLPQTVIFIIIGFGTIALMFGFRHFPMNGVMGNMLLAMVLFVIASQSFALFVCCVMPNMRLALSICSLTGILAFSIAAFSFPVSAMYGAIGIFSYILPVRYYFLIYLDEALRGVPIYFARTYYIALLVFPIVAMAAAPLLKRHMRHPVYVP